MVFTEIGQAIAVHYQMLHPHPPDVIRYGEHYIAYPAPLRCDFCTAVAELPYWTHRADPPVHQPDKGFIDTDGRWLICDACHVLIANGDALGLVTRHWDVGVGLTPVGNISPQVKVNVQAEVLAIVTRMLVAFDAGTRNTVR